MATIKRKLAAEDDVRNELGRERNEDSKEGSHSSGEMSASECASTLLHRLPPPVLMMVLHFVPVDDKLAQLTHSTTRSLLSH